MISVSRIATGSLLAGVLIASSLTAAAQVASAATVAPPAAVDGYQTANDGAIAAVDLSGTWGFTPVSPAASATTIQVPGGGWYKQGFTSTTEGTYSRSITVPDSGAPQTVRLELGAVNHQATVAINGATVGTSTQSFTGATFDLTPFVSAGGTYTVTVDVKGRGALLAPSGKYAVAEGAEWSEAVPQGIYRSAFLRVYPRAYVSDTYVTTSVANNTVSYTTTVTNTSSTAQNVTLSGSFSSWNNSGFTYPSVPSTNVSVPANSSVTTTVGPLAWTAGAASLWWPNVPYTAGYRAQLHVLALHLQGSGFSGDTQTRFGFREFTLPDNSTNYLLNGVPVNLRGDDLQGADFDRIDNGGKGDAYDTLPGFLPPAGGNGGWPQAVDNYQRLNYNIVRIHQEPASPYMIDTADELGLMIIDETAIRGSANREDFVAGHDQMVNHARQLALRDRQHPAVVMWSPSNEANLATTDSEQFQEDLYHAIRGVDPTRPIQVEYGTGTSSYPDMTTANGYPQYNGVGHYLDGFSTYGTTLPTSTTHPNGEGEYVWPGGSTLNGMTLFATSTIGKRGKGGADLRPYTLLSAWDGFVPGVKSTDFTTEERRNPLFGADNLTDPWSNSRIQLIQKAFNPVAAVDLPFWDASGPSDSNGTFPVPTSVPDYAAGQAVSRTVTVFNDTFAGTTVGFSWTANANSPTGPVIASGSSNLTVPLGGRTNTSVNFTAPASGTNAYLTFTTTKNGSTLFSDSTEYLTTLGSTSVDDAQLGTGTNQFSYTGSWSHGANGAGLFNGTNSYSSTTGDTATIAFSGTSIQYFAVKAPNHGIVGVSIDGGAETQVDLYAAIRAGDQLVWTSPTLSAGNHTLTIRVTGAKNASSTGAYGVIDRVVLPAASAPASAIVDDSVQGTGANQFNYTGSWGHTSGESGPYNGTNSYSNTTGDTASFAFNGTSVAYYAVKASNHGVVGVSIDGGAETLVDLYASARAGNQLVWISPTLSAGNHALTVRVTGTKNASSAGTYGVIDSTAVMQ